MKLDELFRELFSKSINKTWSSGGTYTAKIVDEEATIIVEQIIRKHLADNRDTEIGELKAKVFMYEEMISKSSFAPMLYNKEETIKNMLTIEDVKRAMDHPNTWDNYLLAELENILEERDE